MSVNDNAVIGRERIAEDYVGCFPSHAGEFRQQFHCGWHLTVMTLDQRPAARLEIFGFISKESDSLDIAFELRKGGFGKIFRTPIFFEKFSSDNVDLLIGTLGGQDGCNE